MLHISFRYAFIHSFNLQCLFIIMGVCANTCGNNMASSKRARVEEELVSSASKVIKIDLAGFVSMPISLKDVSQSG